MNCFEWYKVLLLISSVIIYIIGMLLIVREYRKVHMTRSRPTAEEFAELRRKRNEEFQVQMKKFAEENGIDLETVGHNHNPDACYCACASGGPCEHVWDGAPWESEEGNIWSTTCSRCGCTALSHDMRVLP